VRACFCRVLLAKYDQGVSECEWTGSPAFVAAPCKLAGMQVEESCPEILSVISGSC